MDIQHVNIKLFIENPEAVNLDDYTGIFNGWIQQQWTEELLVDVADYQHVHAGPGVVLVAHEAHYSIDNAANRLGLLYGRKTKIDGSTVDKLVQATQATLKAAQKLEKEQKLKFNTREVQVIINDRLLAPNTTETLGALLSDLNTFFGRLFDGAEFVVDHNADPRERFTVTVTTAGKSDAATLLSRLASETEAVNA
jgi:hypothetical protein